MIDQLKSADAVEPVKTGLLGNKEAFAPKKEAVTGVIEKIRAELLEDGDVSEDVIALTVLLDKSGQLKEYFSKYEQKELKEKLEVIRKSEAGTTVKELLWYIDSLDASIMISTMIDPTLDARLLLDLCWPDSFTPEPMLIKAINASLWVNLDTLPLSVIAFGP